jgi:2'-5' RNA ligase
LISDAAIPGAKIRLFVAVDPGPVMIERIGRAIERVRPTAPEVKWARPDNIHVTLAFLGHTDSARVPKLEAALANVAERHGSMRLLARGAGTFGSSRRPRVLWTALSGEVEALVAVQGELERALLPLGYEPEKRAFTPHLTLARSRDPRGDAKLAACALVLKEENFGEACIDALVLYRSDLSPAGARYTALARRAFGER